MNNKLTEFLEQLKECDRIIEEQEGLRESIFKRIDEILENEEQDIIPL
jgi:hypothetical protein